MAAPGAKPDQSQSPACKKFSKDFELVSDEKLSDQKLVRLYYSPISPLLTFRVYGVNKEGEEIFLANGNVMSNNRTSTRTDRQGQFTITVNPNVGRLVLTFSDPEHRFMKTTKVREN